MLDDRVCRREVERCAAKGPALNVAAHTVGQTAMPGECPFVRIDADNRPVLDCGPRSGPIDEGRQEIMAASEIRPTRGARFRGERARVGMMEVQKSWRQPRHRSPIHADGPAAIGFGEGQ